MRYIFKFPDIGEGLDEGTIAEWYVQKGQEVEMGESLVKMETDKVVTDIPSPKSGRIAQVYGQVGETIHVGEPLVEFDLPGVEGEAAQEEAGKPDFEPITEEGAGVVGTLEIADNSAYLPPTDEAESENFGATTDAGKRKKALATPVARAMAKDLNIDINQVVGTGPAGRVMKEDIRNHRTKATSTVQKTPMSSELPDQPVEVIKMSQIRKAIAKNMIRSKQQAAHMSMFDEVEISELIRVREQYKNRFAAEGIRLSFLPFILKATATALKEFPLLNAEMNLEAGELVLKKYYNLGIAVDADDGLVVPVIRNVDRLTIKEIAIETNRIAEKARNRNLSLDDMKDGTFSITNFGSIGGQFAVPVINYPQAAILGVGKLMKKPVVKDDQVVPGNVLPLSISVDHRIVDGGEVTRFMNRIMEYLSDPVSLIMG